VAIRKSAAAEIEQLIGDLCAGDQVARETAAARLAVIGPRAVPHLVAAVGLTESPAARAAILKILEGSPDRRSVDLAVEQLHDQHADAKVRAAGIALLGAHLDQREGPRALDELSAFALDAEQPDALRLHALDVVGRVHPDVVAPLRKLLAVDLSPAVRAWASGTAGDARPAIDPRQAVESAAAGDPFDPALLRELVPAGSAEAPLPTLHRLVEVARAREESAPAPADRLEWVAVRGSVHLALARRSSRVAVYDLREALAGGPAALPAEFVEAAALVGDSSCLEPIAERLARTPSTVDRADQQWRDGLIRAGRAIVERERLTRRHAAMRRIARLSPEVAAALLARTHHE
jgi:hypothetical protein